MPVAQFTQHITHYLDTHLKGQLLRLYVTNKSNRLHAVLVWYSPQTNRYNTNYCSWQPPPPPNTDLSHGEYNLTWTQAIIDFEHRIQTL